MEEVRDRLIGKLALPENTNVEGVIIGNLVTNEVIFVEKVDRPVDRLGRALGAYKAAKALRDHPSGMPLLIRIEGSGPKSLDLSHEPAVTSSIIFSDDEYLLYTELSTRSEKLAYIRNKIS